MTVAGKGGSWRGRAASSSWHRSEAGYKQAEGGLIWRSMAIYEGRGKATQLLSIAWLNSEERERERERKTERERERERGHSTLQQRRREFPNLMFGNSATLLHEL